MPRRCWTMTQLLRLMVIAGLAGCGACQLADGMVGALRGANLVSLLWGDRSSSHDAALQVETLVQLTPPSTTVASGGNAATASGTSSWEERLDRARALRQQSVEDAGRRSSPRANCTMDCHYHGDCIRGKCSCYWGWKGPTCGEPRQWCPRNCLGLGVCDTRTFKCECFPGYAGDDCGIVIPECPLNCSGKGNCNQRTGKCSCFNGFSGEACTKAYSICPAGCSGRGKCLRDGTCKCQQGFTGDACDRIKPNACPDSCSGHGRCVDGQCLCVDGFSGQSCEDVEVRNPSGAYGCPSQCSGKGVCVGSECQCSYGWYGDRCDKSYYDCIDHCSGHGTCGPFKVCDCLPGFAGHNCGEVVEECPDNCMGYGRCVADYKWGFLGGRSRCVCDKGSRATGANCGEVDFDLDILCPMNCSGHGSCAAGSGVCTCNGEWGGEDCGTPLFNCPKNCSGKGVCQYGKCSCVHGYGGRACENKVRACPKDCSGHGKCTDSGVCECNSAYGGSDCSKSCRDLSCGGHGTCEHAECTCDAGWAGESCDMEGTCPNDCNGKGVCEDGRCVCNFDRGGEDCGHFQTDEYTRVFSCNLPALSNCSGHGACSPNEDKRGVHCACLQGWGGVDCNEDLTLVDHVFGGDCLSDLAKGCVAQWIEQGCPESDFADFAMQNPRCAGEDECFRAAKHLGKCPFSSRSAGHGQHSGAANMTTTFVEFCQQEAAVECMRMWIDDLRCNEGNRTAQAAVRRRILEGGLGKQRNMTKIFGGRADVDFASTCGPYQACGQLSKHLCPVSERGGNLSNVTLAGVPIEPISDFEPPVNCRAQKAQECVTLWRSEGCPVQGFDPPLECKYYMRCTLEVIYRGHCEEQ